MKKIKTLSVLLWVLIVISSAVYLIPSVSAEENSDISCVFGDVDQNGVVDIKDATLVRKYVAETVHFTLVNKLAVIFDSNRITIKNATEIQKFISGMPTVSSAYGEDIIIEKDVENPVVIDMQRDFFDDVIVISCIKAYGVDYTLEGFPEYEFSHISVYDAAGAAPYNSITLRLKNPSKENVVEAINALYYRTGMDIAYIRPVDIEIPVNP